LNRGAGKLNVFVLIAQLFQKVPALKAMAPTQSEPPFKLTQLVFLVVFHCAHGGRSKAVPQRAASSSLILAALEQCRAACWASADSGEKN